MQLFRTALKEAAWAFLFSRLTILLVSYIGIVLIPQFGTGSPLHCTLGIQTCIFMWYRWDAVAYTGIAHQGYSFTPDVAYFPLWPLLMHYGGLLLGGFFPLSYYLAGLLLANICFFFTLVVLYCLLTEDFEPSLARRALFYLSFYPYALFFFVGYSESLFVFLCVAVFLLLRRGKALDWWCAGALGFLAALTRSSGVLLAIPFLVMYIQQFWLPGKRDQSSVLQKLNAFVPILLIPAALLAYLAYLASTKGNPFLLQSEEVSYWHRHFALLWDTFDLVARSILRGSLFSLDVLKNGVDLAFTLLPLLALVLGWKRLPLHYSLFALAIMLFSLSFPLGTVNPLASQPRYMMTAFPILVIFALWGKRTRFDQAYLAVAIALLAVNTILFITHYWVA